MKYLLLILFFATELHAQENGIFGTIRPDSALILTRSFDSLSIANRKYDDSVSRATRKRVTRDTSRITVIRDDTVTQKIRITWPQKSGRLALEDTSATGGTYVDSLWWGTQIPRQMPPASSACNGMLYYPSYNLIADGWGTCTSTMSYWKILRGTSNSIVRQDTVNHVLTFAEYGYAGNEFEGTVPIPIDTSHTYRLSLSYNVLSVGQSTSLGMGAAYSYFWVGMRFYAYKDTTAGVYVDTIKVMDKWAFYGAKLQQIEGNVNYTPMSMVVGPRKGWKPAPYMPTVIDRPYSPHVNQPWGPLQSEGWLQGVVPPVRFDGSMEILTPGAEAGYPSVSFVSHDGLIFPDTSDHTKYKIFAVPLFRFNQQNRDPNEWQSGVGLELNVKQLTFQDITMGSGGFMDTTLTDYVTYDDLHDSLEVIRDEMAVAASGMSSTQLAQLASSTHFKPDTTGTTKWWVAPTDTAVTDTLALLGRKQTFTQNQTIAADLAVGKVKSISSTTSWSFFFAGLDTGIYVSKDNGESWALSGNSSALRPRSFIGYNNAIYSGTEASGVYKSIDSGTTWTAKNTGFSNYQINGFTRAGSVIVAATGAGTYYTLNEGANWTAGTGYTGSCQGVVFISVGSQKGMYIGTSAGVYKSIDSGKTWSITGLTSGYAKAIIVKDSMVIAAGNFDVKYSINGGTDWSTSSGSPSDWRNSLSTDGINVYVGMGGNYGLYKNTNIGVGSFSNVYGSATVQSSYCLGTKVFGGNLSSGIYSSISGLNGSFSSKNTGLPAWTKTVYAFGDLGQYTWTTTSIDGGGLSVLKDTIHTVAGTLNPQRLKIGSNGSVWDSASVSGNYARLSNGSTHYYIPKDTAKIVVISIPLDSSYINTTDTVIVGSFPYAFTIDSVKTVNHGIAASVVYKILYGQSIISWTAVITSPSASTSVTLGNTVTSMNNAVVPANAYVAVACPTITTKPKKAVITIFGHQ